MERRTVRSGDRIGRRLTAGLYKMEHGRTLQGCGKPLQLYLPLQSPVLQRPDCHYRYQEYVPQKELQSYVACYWTLDTDARHKNEDLHRIIPDGCVDLIFDRNASSVSQGAFAVGLMTTFETMNLPSRCSFFGIRLFIEHARRFLKYPVSEVSGGQVPLEELWGSEANAIAEEVLKANGVSEIIQRIEFRLRRLLLQQEWPSDPMLYASLQYIYAARGRISIRDLASELGYAERSVRRKFQQELGVGPKELLDILRFQYVLRELHSGTRRRLTDIALTYGYYDQPHFIHHFERFYGLPPGQVFR